MLPRAESHIGDGRSLLGNILELAQEQKEKVRQKWDLTIFVGSDRVEQKTFRRSKQNLATTL
jgi:hypothetical protein